MTKLIGSPSQHWRRRRSVWAIVDGLIRAPRRRVKVRFVFSFLRFLVLVGVLLHRRFTALIQRRRADFVILIVVHFHILFVFVILIVLLEAPPAAQQLSLRGTLQRELFLTQRGVTIASDAVLLSPVWLKISIRARHASLRLRERVKLPWLTSLTRRQPALVRVRTNRTLLAFTVSVRE